MKKHFFFFILLLFPLLAAAQTYKYIGVEDGLSNRRVYAIQKGPKGYMWFLTHDGIDRYNGKEFKHYKLMDGEEEVNSMMSLSWLYTDAKGRLWEIGKQGRVFCYESKHDRFQLVYKLPKSETKDLHTPVSYGFIDDNYIVWLCNQKNIYLYDSETERCTTIKNEINESITDIEQIDANHYFIGTDVGIHYAELKDKKLMLSPCNKLDTLKLQVNELFYHKGSRKVFIGTFQRGMYVYDLKLHKASLVKSGLADISINRIIAFGDKEILIATDGAGIHKMNVETYSTEPYIVADFNRYNAMNGNTIYDIYIDEEQRIWMANYPIGITVRNNRYNDYKWIKHSIGNKQSLINDQVNAIIEDGEGDLWFATNNGISLYEHRTKQWHSFLSVFNTDHKNQSHTFISLCEISPGSIRAAALRGKGIAHPHHSRQQQGHAQCNADDPQQKTLHVLLLLCSKKAHPRSLWSDCRCASFVSGVWFILQHPRQVPLRQLPARPFLHRPRQRADARTRPVPFRGGAGKQPQQPVLRQQRPGQ